MAIDGAEVAPSRGEIWVIQNSRFESLRTDIVPGFAAITVERPVGPDAHALCDQRTDVGVAGQIGRASCRERVCQYVSLSVVAASFNKQPPPPPTPHTPTTTTTPTNTH